MRWIIFRPCNGLIDFFLHTRIEEPGLIIGDKLSKFDHPYAWLNVVPCCSLPGGPKSGPYAVTVDGTQRLAELRGAKIAIGAVGSGIRILARELLAANGITEQSAAFVELGTAAAAAGTSLTRKGGIS